MDDVLQVALVKPLPEEEQAAELPFTAPPQAEAPGAHQQQ